MHSLGRNITQYYWWEHFKVHNFLNSIKSYVNKHNSTKLLFRQHYSTFCAKIANHIWHIDYIMTQHSAAVHDDYHVWNKYKQQIFPFWKSSIDVFYYCLIPEQKETYKWKTKISQLTYINISSTCVSVK